MQIGPVNHGIGIAEAGPKGIVQRNAGDFLPVHGVHEAQVVDIDGLSARFVADAEIVERVEGIGAELDAGADLPQFGRAFQNDGTEAFPGQAQRGRQAADAAAGDQDGTIVGHVVVSR